MEEFLKISIITPNYNGAKYLEETIKSVVLQGYPNLEYIIIDGGSTDGSLDIIKKYEKHLSYWISEPDNGLYHALQKGFERSTGEIMGWINSDDLLHPNSLFIIKIQFQQKNCRWITGINTTANNKGYITKVIKPYNTTRFQFLNNEYLNSNSLKGYGTIQQESTFWHRCLWEKAGEYISTDYSFAGDFELWMRFFRYESLHVVETLLGAFRVSSNQLSIDNIHKYIKECQEICSKELNQLTKTELKAFRWYRLKKRNWFLRKVICLKSYCN